MNIVPRSEARKAFEPAVRISLLEADADEAEMERDELATMLKLEAEKTRLAISRLTGAAMAAAFSFATAAIVLAITIVIT